MRFLSAATVVLTVLVLLFQGGTLQFNYPDRNRFPVRGVDVSHHQGAIDWQRLARQDVAFAYLKATEGGGFKDKRFAYNWREARAAGFAVGAYHFFLPGKSGREQAENFIASVPQAADALPPVLDVECPVVPPGPERNRIRANIQACLALLEIHYGKTPVIYTTYAAFAAYVSGLEQHHPLWIRSVFAAPDEKVIQHGWRFWQYSARGVLDGYSGRERFIDLNVFNGTEQDFVRFWRGPLRPRTGIPL